MNKLKFDYAELPLTRLHYVHCGKGEPLVIVPATISEVDNWSNLIQFFGRRFRTYFFELPGHKGSSPFAQPYSSDLVAQTVEDFIDRQDLRQINLMGFSFGGILAMKTLARLQRRVKNVVLFAPCLDKRAIRYSPLRIAFVRNVVRMMDDHHWQERLLSLLHHEMTASWLVAGLRRIGHVETNEHLKQKLLALPDATLEVLVAQINEIVNINFDHIGGPYPQPCFFGMSRQDPLLDYDITAAFVKRHFLDVVEVAFDFPFHQPPQPLTMRELEGMFRAFKP